MSARVFCMASSKGGSGKTVLTATFGAFLSAIGKSVLLVDTDASTNGLTLLHLKEVLMGAELAIGQGRKPKGTYEITALDWEPEIVKLASGAHLVPAAYAFTNTDLKSEETYGAALERMMVDARDSYDFIFVDAQAGSDSFAHIAMSKRVSDEVIIVSEYDPMSAAGVERLKALFREDLTYVRTWVLLNKMLPEFVKSFSDFLEVAKYLSPIPWNADVVRAYARRKLALDLEHGNEFTLAVMQTLRTLLGDTADEEIQAWAASKESEIRRPIEEQYRDIEMEIQGLMTEEKRITLRKVQRKMFSSLAVGTTASIFLTGFLLSSPMKSLIEKGFSTTIDSGIILTFTIIPVLVSLVFVLRARFLTDLEGYDFDEMQLERQRRFLEEKLKAVDTLRQADLRSLLKAK